MFAKAPTIILLCAVLLQACSPAPAQTTPPEPTASVPPTPVASVQATAVPTATSQPILEPTVLPTPTATIQPTPEPTATVWPPVFVFWSLRDIREELTSFVVTVNEKNTINGKLAELTSTIGYIKQPYSAYHLNQYASGVDQTYVVDGWTYSLTGSGDWYISAGSTDSLFSKADIPGGNTGKLLDAQFVGQEDYQGIPAYHFVLAATNSTDTNSQVEGDFYLARDGNYVLYSHWKETSTQGDFKQVYEVTQALSSINQLAEIKLPGDMTDMVAAAKLPIELGLPVPTDSTVKQMIRYKSGIGVDYYFFTKPQMSAAEFLDFYRQLPSTNGWKVTHIGHVTLHQDDCEFTWDCVIINNGNTQVILFYSAGSLRAEFDWPRLYAPKVGN